MNRINAVYFFSIEYRYTDILFKKHTQLDFICGILCIVVTVYLAAIQLTIYCIGMVSVTTESRYVTSTSRYQSRSSMYIRGLITRNSMALAEAVSIEIISSGYKFTSVTNIYTCTIKLQPNIFFER